MARRHMSNSSQRLLPLLLLAFLLPLFVYLLVLPSERGSQIAKGMPILLDATETDRQKLAVVLPSYAKEVENDVRQARAIAAPEVANRIAWWQWLREAIVLSIALVGIGLLWHRKYIWRSLLIVAAISYVWISGVPGVLRLLLKTSSLNEFYTVITFFSHQPNQFVKDFLAPLFFMGAVALTLFVHRRWKISGAVDT